MGIVKQDRENIWAKFNRSELAWNETLSLLEKCPPSWHSKGWKNRRKDVLGSACETCGKTEQLLIQHLWHPAPFRVLCEQVKIFLRLEYEKDHPYIPPVFEPFDPDKVSPQESTLRNSCPKCGSVNIKYRKKESIWKCCYVKKGWYTGRPDIICGHEFETPKVITWSKWPEEQWIEMARHHYERAVENPRREWENAFIEDWRDRICYEATKLVYEEDQRYSAMRPEDVKTLCKKCAFIEDLPRIELKKISGLW